MMGILELSQKATPGRARAILLKSYHHYKTYKAVALTFQVSISQAWRIINRKAAPGRAVCFWILARECDANRGEPARSRREKGKDL